MTFPPNTPLAHSFVTVLAATLLVGLTLGAAGCSSHTSATSTPKVSASAQVKPSSRPTPPPAPSPKRTSMTSRGRTPVPYAKPVRFAGATPLSRSLPLRLQIASIGVDTAVMKLGLRADGSMQVPTGGFPAGWYTGSPTPGELGPAVVVGHVDMRGPGVFYKLHDVKPGELVSITRQDGSTPVFRVTQVEEFPKSAFPKQRIFGSITHAGLRLITCGGAFNSRTGHYEDNLVVFAELVEPQR